MTEDQLTMFIDNSSTMKLSENPVIHSRSRYINDSIRDFIERQEIKSDILERFVNELDLKRYRNMP
jgi:predicted transcriptional regulator